jgi:ArsR family transcriptional regulator
MKHVSQIKAEHFKALADPTRLKLLDILLSHKQVLCVCAIAEKLGVSQPAVSQHLKILKNAGLVKGKRHGYHVHYTINAQALASFKEHLEKMHRKAADCCKRIETQRCCNKTKEGR